MTEFNLPNMSCGHCVKSVTAAIMQLDAQAKVEIDLDSKAVRIESTADAAALTSALTEAGYSPA